MRRTSSNVPSSKEPKLAMGNRVVTLNRRQVLRGAGGFTLALPFLPSLMSRAHAAEPTYTALPRMFWLTSDHGGAYETNMFPSTSLLTQTQQLYPDHAVHAGALKGVVDGQDTVVSPILRARSSSLTPARLAKMNVLYGLDVPFYLAHNTGGHLGNYARNDGNGADGVEVQKYPRPTIDQLMAWSPSFYPDLSSVKERAMVMSDRPISWRYSNPAQKTGTIENVRGYASSLDLFNTIFVPPDVVTPRRAPIVDRVLESYKRLRNGNRRLSSLDRQRLDDHMARIAELQRKLNAKASCGAVATPTDDANRHTALSGAEATQYGELFNDVVVAAFICGTSRLGVLGLGYNEQLAGYAGDWHQDVAHQWQLPDKQVFLVSAYQRLFSTLLLDLAEKLDAVDETPGVTYLDNSLLVWSQECCMSTHDSVSLPVVTFGSAGGYLKTGQLVDYRRTTSADSKYDPGAGGVMYLGLLYNQWLATVLQAMRIPPAEFELWGHKGYGVPYVSPDTGSPPYAKHYQNTSSRYFTDASKVLPFLRA